MARQKKLYDKPEGDQAINPPATEAAEEEETKQIEESEPKFKFRTELGRKIASGEITSIKEIFSKGLRIKEPAIIDALVPELYTDFILTGQARGKFGGGKRRLVKQTQKKTAEGNKPSFAALAVVGNRNGYVGIGKGRAKESIPAKEKAIRNAKLSIMEVVRGCGSWKCGCGEPHSLPYEVEGKSGSVRIKLMPAPKGTGLVCEDEIKKVLKAAGFKDLWVKSFGQTKHRYNFISALFDALKKSATMRAKDYKVYRGAV